MAKNISLSEEAYKKLSLEKHPGESYSDVILRLLPKRSKLIDVIGKKLIDENILLNEIRKASLRSMERIISENS